MCLHTVGVGATDLPLHIWELDNLSMAVKFCGEEGTPTRESARDFKKVMYYMHVSKKGAVMVRILRGLPAVGLFFLSVVAYAEPQPPQGGSQGVVAGSIEYSPVDAPQRNGQLLSLEKVSTWAEQLEKGLREGGKVAPEPLDESTLSYLSVLYLYCVSNQGVCGFLLDSVLEGDLISARESGKPACPMMKRFWKAWLSSGLEERAKFNKSITQGLEVAEFNSTKRPSYIKCGETIQELLADTAALEKRYGPEGSSTKEVAKFIKFLNDVEANKIDIYRSTGVMDESVDADKKAPAGQKK